MKTLSHTATKLLLSAGVVFLLSMVGSGYVWLTIRSQGMHYVDQLQVAADVSAQQEAVQTLHQLVATTEVERLEVESYFLDVVQIAQLLEQIEQYAAQRDITIESSQLQQLSAEDEEEIAQVRIPYEVSGTRSEVMRFIELLEALPYHGHMERLSITLPASDRARATANVAIVVSYRQYD